MEKLDLCFLETLTRERIVRNLEEIFFEICDKLQTFLGLDIINTNVKIVYVADLNDLTNVNGDILSLGVKKAFQQNLWIIEFFNEYQNYLPIFLVREALMCFVPDDLKENKSVKIVINLIVEIVLNKLKIIKEWKLFFREHIVDSNFLSAMYDKLEKFLKFQDTKSTETALKFFFSYIKKKLDQIDDSKEDDFQHNILKDFILETSSSLINNELIETIRILIKIFYKVKYYNALFKYQNYFKQFKETGAINTNLSLRKFTSNVRWIRNFSAIAPTYQINYKKIGIDVIFCNLRFNPQIENSKISLIVEKLPFFLSSKSSECSFAVDISGWFLLPLSYQEDVFRFLDKLEQFGYIINKTCFSYNKVKHFFNLNYFREFYLKKRLINPNHSKYDKKYEITSNENLSNYKEIHFTFHKLSLIEYLIINRVRYWASDGLSFEKKSETISTIKSDLFNEFMSRSVSLKKLKRIIESLHSNLELKQNILQFLNRNFNLGFFYIKELLEKTLMCSTLIINTLRKHTDIIHSNQFIKYVKNRGITQKIEENIVFRNLHLRKSIFRDLVPLYFKNKAEFIRETKKYKKFLAFFQTCFALKIFDLRALIQIIEDEDTSNSIYAVKGEKLRKLRKKHKVKNVSGRTIDDGIESLINENPPIIKPLLVDTINTTNFAKYFIEIILKENSETEKALYKIKNYFPRVYVNSNENLSMIHIYSPNITVREKELLISILYKLFGDNIIKLKRYFVDGFFRAIRIKDYYDLDKLEFFHNKDLFEQYFIYVKNIFGNKLKSFKETPTKILPKFWVSNKNLSRLTEQIDDRVSREQNSFNINHLYELTKFHQNLEEILSNSDKFKEIRKKDFYDKYIKSIKFEPVFHNFGFGQYFLYIRPINFEEIDLKLLFANNFQKISYPAHIDTVPSLFIKYIFPHRNPNMKYINWLAKSKKIISEYCLFFVKKIYVIFHFDTNLDPTGWNIEANRFKTHMQKVLFDPNFNNQISGIKEYNIGDLFKSSYYGPNSPFFKNLTGIYGAKSIDIKSYLGGMKYAIIEKILNLLQNKLIVPHIKLKNLNFQDKFYIILPSVKKELIEKIVKIFNFFNYCLIYDIEGEYFIKDLEEYFDDKIKFEHGLLIKLYLPSSTNFSDLQPIFDKLFQFLEIKKYIILNDMVEGKNLIKATFGYMNFSKYNPLKNLIWNEKDKIWKNVKLFNENFEPQYPNLIP